MRYLLDTCVLSELARPKPDTRVAAWLDEQNEDDLFLSVLTIGELESGVEALPEAPRKARLRAWLRDDLRQRFQHRLLPVTSAVAAEWGRLQAQARREGRPLPAVDSLIAATARAHGLVLVTRNVSDMARTGVTILDPWSPAR